jgi:hypothetical protein
MMRNLLFGLNIDPRADRMATAFQLASLADEHGLDFVSVMDHPEQPRFLETWTLLVALAMRTRRVAVMPNVATIPLRPPAMLAKAASSLALLTQGRVLLGIGAGDPKVVRPYGGPIRGPREAVDAVAEAVEVIRRVWDSQRERVSFQGRHYRLAGARPGPRPPVPIPLWIGSFGPRLLQLTGRLADGWAPTNRYADPDQIDRIRHHVDRGASRPAAIPPASAATTTSWAPSTRRPPPKTGSCSSAGSTTGSRRSGATSASSASTLSSSGPSKATSSNRAAGSRPRSSPNSASSPGGRQVAANPARRTCGDEGPNGLGWTDKLRGAWAESGGLGRSSGRTRDHADDFPKR